VNVKSIAATALSLALLFNVSSLYAGKNKYDPANFPLTATVLKWSQETVDAGRTTKVVHPLISCDPALPWCRDKLKTTENMKTHIVMKVQINNDVYTLMGDSPLERGNYHVRKHGGYLQFLCYRDSHKPYIVRFEITGDEAAASKTTGHTRN
jgi:hypothetical protein